MNSYGLNDDQKDALKDHDAGSIVQVEVGIYADTEHPEIMLINPGELLVKAGLDDTQEARAAIMVALSRPAIMRGIEIVLIRDETVPSIEAAVSEPSTRRCSKCGATYTDLDAHDCGLPEPDDGDVYSDADAPDPRE